MSRKKLIVLCVMIFLCFLFLMKVAQSSSQKREKDNQCHEGVIRRARKCFSHLTHSAISSNTQEEGSEWLSRIGRSNEGTALLDYSQILKSCGTDYQMAKFDQCIQKVSSRCKSQQTASFVDKIMGHHKVNHPMVPTLCGRQNEELDAASQCLTAAMNKKSTCQENVYAKVKTFMSQTARNSSAMFIIQCRFSFSLAECQRMAVTEHCSPDLGDLHRDFLLSFIPEACFDIHDEDTGGWSHVVKKNGLHGESKMRIQPRRTKEG